MMESHHTMVHVCSRIITRTRFTTRYAKGFCVSVGIKPPSPPPRPLYLREDYTDRCRLTRRSALHLAVWLAKLSQPRTHALSGMDLSSLMADRWVPVSALSPRVRISKTDNGRLKENVRIPLPLHSGTTRATTAPTRATTGMKAPFATRFAATCSSLSLHVLTR